MKRIVATIAGCALLLGVAAGGLADAGKKKAPPKETTEAPLQLVKHPVLGVPLFEGATEASEKALRGMGLDAFDGYQVGAFFTNAPAIDVAMFYVRALRRTIKKEESDGNLRYTLMIEPPSADNPLGEKVVIDQGDGGAKDETGKTYKTVIAVYRKKVAPKPAKPEPRSESKQTSDPR